MTALALRDDQTQWDANQIAVLEAGGIDGDVSDAELAAFLHECQRRKLDPFTRQIYLIGRYDRRKGRKVYRSQTSIDGFRLIARRAADRSGIDYSYEDTIWFDEQGKRYEIWLSDKPPAGAKVVVIRNGSRFDAVARFGAYVQTDQNGNPGGQWRSMADVMVAKCAEALALRKAFPEDLGGIYTEEEMAQADNPQRVTATAEVIHEEPPPADIDEEWLSEAPALAASFTAPDEGRRLWRETAAKASARQITPEDAKRIQELIKARMEDLGREQQEQAARTVAEAADPMARLDPDDAWTDRIREIGDEDEAARVLADLGESPVPPAKGHLIRSAILARWPGAAGVTEEAA